MAETLIDKTAIINWALTEIGVGAQFSLDDDSDLSVQIRNTWQRCVDRCFSLTDWSFARRTTKLSRLAEPPNNGWAYGHMLPGDQIGPPLKILDRAGSNPSPLRIFDIEGDVVFADVSEVWARCKVLVEPENWDPAFRAGFVTALGGYLAVPIAQDKNQSLDLLKSAFGMPSEQGGGGQLGRLAAQDRAASAVGQSILADDPLTRAHKSSSSDAAWHGRH